MEAVRDLLLLPPDVRDQGRGWDEGLDEYLNCDEKEFGYERLNAAQKHKNRVPIERTTCLEIRRGKLCPESDTIHSNIRPSTATIKVDHRLRATMSPDWLETPGNRNRRDTSGSRRSRRRRTDTPATHIRIRFFWSKPVAGEWCDLYIRGLETHNIAL